MEVEALSKGSSAKHPGRAADFSMLPLQLLVAILRFLDVHEIHSLNEVKWFREALTKYEHLTLFPLYQEVFNIPREEDLPALVRKIDNVWRTRAIIDLPFWGYHADSGVLYHSLPFWIGKAFLKTSKPIVGMAGMRSGSFSGCLSQDYYEFTGIVQSLSKIFRELYQSPDFEVDMERIDLRTVIMQAFHSDMEMVPESLIHKRLRELKERLYSYAIKMSRMLQAQDGPDILNEEIIRLPLTASIHRIEISREFRADFYESIHNCMQTLVVGVRKEHTFDQLDKVSLPPIVSTNLNASELPHFSLTKKYPVEADSTYKYVIFEPNDEGLLLWLDFGNSLKVEIPLPYASRVWTNEVHACILRGKKQSTSAGLTLSYIAFKGIMI